MAAAPGVAAQAHPGSGSGRRQQEEQQPRTFYCSAVLKWCKTLKREREADVSIVFCPLEGSALCHRAGGMLR